MYALGIDLGTTFTAAGTWRDGHTEIASLGSRAAAIPSVVLLRADETFLIGETANRRGLTEPHRLAREFKRRLGDTTPILLGGVPYSAEALTARLLRAVVDEVATREGGLPGAICICHPANWGPYKTDLLRQAIRIADLDQPVNMITEPEAAAVFYAHQQRIEPGAIVAVYDLGGGTFDAAVLRKTVAGFEILGQPEGIERLGGIDFDAAVFNYVSRALGSKLQELDEDDPAAIAAVARLREECIDAKEALSSDTDVSIPVLLPNASTEVRLTRAELEAMVRPALYDSIEALKRALRSAGVTPDDLHSVLLVGGSSRIPIVAQLVGAELARPVAVDAHPKHAVALGSAWLASTWLGDAAGPATRPPVSAPTASPPALRMPARSSRAPAPPAPTPPDATPTQVVPAVPAPPAAPIVPIAPTLPIVPIASSEPGPAQPPAPEPLPPWPAPPERRPPPRQPSSSSPPPPASPPPRQPGGDSDGDGGQPPRRGPLLLIVVGAIVAALLAVAGYLLNNQDQDTSDTITPRDNSIEITESPSSSATDDGEALPPDEQCTDAIKENPKWVCLRKATFDGYKLTIEYEANWNGSTPNIDGGFHLHIWGSDGTTPPDSIMGTQSDNQGDWYVEDKEPSIRKATSKDFQQAIGEDAPKVCARIADGNHRLVKDRNGGYKTGNCVPITQP
jgi:actin-like ATPase involved in cell morphogenesis